MAIYEANFFEQGYPSPHSAGELMVCKGKVELDDQVALNDLIKLAVLPAGCVPVDIILASEDLDSGAAMVVDVGILNAAEDDLDGTDRLVSAQAFQTEQVVRANAIGALDIAVDKTNDRIIAMKVTTAAGTAVAGNIMSNFLYRAAEYGE